ncbi:phospholipase A2 AP-PLA2-I-like isoform X2 [Acanthaster planci]|uniref:Phospholipase A2 n=1 Tax=Acanthaster planci TaxID=133434 RepID=A0A8B7Y465_ACAPL|nr:phospholipase A2 AP-PLA2-I-like isoform X2 [Acanthaster planci]
MDRWSEIAITANAFYQLGELAVCTTGLNLIEGGLAYNHYGCYCGLGGAGTPLDATDTCCYVHDNCYTHSPCSINVFQYSIPYKKSVSSCGTADATITCKKASDYPWYYGSEKDCAEAICNCDKDLAYCFRETRSTYNEAYRNWSNSKC